MNFERENSWNFVKFCQHSWNIFNFEKPFLFITNHFRVKSNEIRKFLWNQENFEKKWPNGVMIVLCEIGWPQKSPWVRMIWMISCKETIKINSKTWLRFYLIIKTNISKFLIFELIWFIFENSIKMVPSCHTTILFTVGLLVTWSFLTQVECII